MARAPTCWTQTAAGRAHAREAISRWNAERDKQPKCKATARSTGERCGNLALKNGCCYYHGGRTPSGEGWHRPRWPNADAPDSEAKLNRKLRDLDRAARKRARRLAAMMPEERERHENWQRTHKAGDAVARAAKRQARENSEAVQALIAQPVASASPVLAALQEQIDRARRRAIQIQIETSEEGIFG